MNYGVQPTGFVRKPISVILAEMEASLITEFGPGVIQTPQSPLGQLNGLMADLTAEVWELCEQVYQSYDPDQAEGSRLDTLAKLRRVSRGSQEVDDVFRKAITNQNAARIGLADIVRSVNGVPGVYFSQVFVNETGEVDENRMPPNTIAVAVLGGEDDAVASAVSNYIPPGISTHGNVNLSSVEEGYCRTVRVIRPIEVELELEIQVKMSETKKGCPAPSPIAVGSALLNYLTQQSTRPWNGQDITPYLTRSFVEANFEGVEYVNQIGTKVGEDNPYYSLVPFDFFEIARVTSVSVLVVD